jgi:hypothetical protein
MPRLQPLARMTRDEKRAYLLATIELALALMSDIDDASVFVSPSSVSSPASNKNNEDNVQAPQ